MIKSIQYQNFKALRDSRLELGRFTLLVGPNGSGKSTALQGLTYVTEPGQLPSPDVTCAFIDRSDEQNVRVDVMGDGAYSGVSAYRECKPGGRYQAGVESEDADKSAAFEHEVLRSARFYSMQADRISAPVTLQPQMKLAYDGFGLVVVLDRLRDQHPERFEVLNDELGRLIPEFDRVLFDTPAPGNRSLQLRTRVGHHAIPAVHVSQGTLLALALLTLAHLDAPPPVIGLEEPDHGLHPRLLRDVRDAIYRLCYPENFGEDREPVQVIATTHSPYMLDLFRDHPDEIVICQRTEDNTVFQRLSDRSDLQEILHDTHLGDAWYSGILGGVPAEK